MISTPPRGGLDRPHERDDHWMMKRMLKWPDSQPARVVHTSTGLDNDCFGDPVSSGHTSTIGFCQPLRP